MSSVTVPKTIVAKGEREVALYLALWRDGRSYYSSDATRPSWYREGFRAAWDTAIAVGDNRNQENR